MREIDSAHSLVNLARNVVTVEDVDSRVGTALSHFYKWVSCVCLNCKWEVYVFCGKR